MSLRDKEVCGLELCCLIEVGPRKSNIKKAKRHRWNELEWYPFSVLTDPKYYHSTQAREKPLRSFMLIFDTSPLESRVFDTQRISAQTSQVSGAHWPRLASAYHFGQPRYRALGSNSLMSSVEKVEGGC